MNSRMFKRCFKEFSKGVSGKFQGCYKEIPSMLQQCFEGVSRKLSLVSVCAKFQLPCMSRSS